MSDDDILPPEPYTFCNCGRRKGCPDARVLGGDVVLSEDVGELVALEEPRVGLRFTPEQARELAAWLVRRGFGP